MLWDMRDSVLLTMLLLLTPAAQAAPEVRLNNVFYSVSGDTAEALWADVLAKTPVEHNGKKHVAYTRWHVNWRFWWQSDRDSCDITRVTTRMDVTYTLPRLESNAGTPETVTQSWDRYYAALFAHEQGHKDLGEQAANEIEQQIASMGPRENCAQLETDANTIARNVMDRYSRIEKEYDRSTNHGMNIGAVFP